MGTTFVTLSPDSSGVERGFWMRDTVLELWLRLLALNIPEPKPEEHLAQKIRQQWLLASCGYFIGCVPDGLGEAVRSEEGREIVRKAIVRLVRKLRQIPHKLDASTLNLLGIEGVTFQGDPHVGCLLEVGDAFLRLLDGQIVGTVKDTDFMPGSNGWGLG